MDSSNVYIYPHLHFSIGYNEDQIVAVQISTDVSSIVFCFRSRFPFFKCLCMLLTYVLSFNISSNGS